MKKTENIENIAEFENKTEEMIEFEQETGKKAIWRGNITDAFKKWQNGERVYAKNKERINILVSEERKNRWQNFAEENNISTISDLIRNSVENYIEVDCNLKNLEVLSNISHKLKEELSSIKGFSQILIEQYKDDLSWDILLKIKEIYDKSINMEKLLNRILNNQDDTKNNFDILIVDDDNSTIYLISEYFKKKNYIIKATGFGSDVIDLINKNPPKIILLDILLPDSDGYEICRKIKANDKLKDIPIFYITAVPESEVRRNFKKTGANGYFLKPFNMSDFNILSEYL
ncbi:MAG: response regulator [Candidatus Hermodarchaeota archaeon]